VAFAVAESTIQINLHDFERGEADARRLHPVQRDRSVGEHERSAGGVEDSLASGEVY
jgi:hypothetical protein